MVSKARNRAIVTWLAEKRAGCGVANDSVRVVSAGECLWEVAFRAGTEDILDAYAFALSEAGGPDLAHVFQTVEVWM